MHLKKKVGALLYQKVHTNVSKVRGKYLMTAGPTSTSALSENGFFSPNDPDLGSWTSRFIKAGGLKLLFSIFASGDLQSRDGTVWCEWRQDCLSALLKLLLQFGVNPEDYDALAEQILEGVATPRKRMRRGHTGRKSSGYAASSSRNSIIVPRYRA